jgi:hypothetical protein
MHGFKSALMVGTDLRDRFALEPLKQHEGFSRSLPLPSLPG